MTALPGVPRQADATVTGINNRGQIIGLVDERGSGAVLWTPKSR